MDDLRTLLEEALARQVESADDAERAATAASALAAYLRAVEAARRALDVTSRGSPPNGPADLSALTLHDAAERVLDLAGVPLHVKELGARIKAGGWRHKRATPRPDQINYQLAARLPRHPDKFARVAPNTFSLSRWGPDRSAAPSSPPRLGSFRGPGGKVGASLGDHAGEPASVDQWRSS